MKKLLVALALLLFPVANAWATGFCNIGFGSNLSGYCQIAGGYTAIAATIQIPLTAQNGAPTTHGPLDVLQWVGIGPVATPIQTGVALQMNSDNTITYQAWYGSGGPITLLSTTTYPVAPSDIFTMSIICRTNCTTSAAGQTWDFDLIDTHLDGTSWTFANHAYAFVDDLSRAMFATEAPVYSGPSTGNFPNYGLIPWKNAMINGINPNFISANAANGIDSNSDQSTFSAPVGSTNGFVACGGQSSVPTCDPNPVFTRTIAGGAGR